MTTNPSDDQEQSEPTIADVMNSFSLDSGRRSRRRRWGRHRDEQHDEQATSADQFDDDLLDDIDDDHEEYPDHLTGEFDGPDPVGGSTFVRPYAWTRGRTRTGYVLEIETLVSTSQRGREQLALLQVEHRVVAELCEQARSVAEVAALLKVPLGVAKVLVGDMAGLGLVAVHQSVSANGDVPDLALMERVLSGLRRL